MNTTTDTSGDNKRVAIFRAGTHTDMRGATIRFGETDLAAMVSAYDPAKHEAPLVVGHPATNGPAYGWVKGLSLDGDTLYADPHQVDPAFAELVKAGRYKKISASFYAPGSSSNPAPQGYYLRHVGFLGAQPPAVKGLRDASFDDGGQGVVTVTFEEPGGPDPMHLLARLAAWLQGGANQPPAPPAKPQFSETDPQQENNMPQPGDQAAAKEAELKKKEADLAVREAAFAEKEKAVEARAAAERQKEHVAFVEKAVADGRVLPRHQAPLVAVLSRLDEGGDLSFADGDGNNITGAGSGLLRELIDSLPARVDYRERGAESGADEVVNFATPPGFEIDRAALALHKKISAHAKANNITFAEAALAVGDVP